MDRKYAKLFAGAAAVALAISSVGSAVAQDESAAPEAAAGDGYVIGVSNTVQGNGWREEMICSIKAQALASGEVASLNIAHRNTDAAGQLEDIRNLIAAGVDAIIVNPADPRPSTRPSRKPRTPASPSSRSSQRSPSRPPTS